MRGQRPGSCEHLRRRRPPPSIPRPIRLGGHTEHRRERHLRLAQRNPVLTQRAGLHDVTPCHRCRPPGSAGVARVYFSQPIFGPDRSLCSLHIRRGMLNVGTIGVFSRKMARPAGFEPATPGLEGRSGEKTRNNTEQSGTENWFVCRVALLPHCVQDRVRDASGHGKRWIVPSPHAPRRRRRTPAPLPATGATRGPVRGCWGRGGGCRPRRRDRAPWAGGGPDGGRRAPGDRRASRDHRPLMALLEPS